MCEQELTEVQEDRSVLAQVGMGGLVQTLSALASALVHVQLLLLSAEDL